MSDGRPDTDRTIGAPSLDPRGERRFIAALLATGLAIPLLAALYGWRRDGGEGAGAGFFIGLLCIALPMIYGAGRLLERLTGRDQSPRLRRERLYWAVSISIAVILAAVTVVATSANEVERSYGLDGWVDGATFGAVAGEAFLLLAARVHAWLVWLTGPAAAKPQDLAKWEAPLAPALAELEAARMWAGRRIRRRDAWMLPLGLGAGLALWGIFVLVTRELDLFLPVGTIIVGGIVGHGLAVRRLAIDYELRYKTSVLPLLVGPYGGLAYDVPPPPDLHRLRELRVFDRFTSAYASDRIAGDYQGRAIDIVQLELDRGWGVWTRRVFHGLLIEIKVDCRYLGTTAIVADAGPFASFLRELAARSIRRVGLESPAFEREFEVYATDQVMARALLTPTFMERFSALGKLEGFARPLALAQDNVLVIAAPRSDEWRGSGRGAHRAFQDFFAPPDYDDTAYDSDVLKRLDGEINTVLRTLDAVIALDRPDGLSVGREPLPTGAGKAGRKRRPMRGAN